MKLPVLFLWHLYTCLHVRAEHNLPPPQYDIAVDDGTQGFYPTRSYITGRGIRSPKTNFLQWSPQCDDGLKTFITPRGWAEPSPGPMVLDDRGELIWAHHYQNAFGGEGYNFLVQKYKGEDYLTFWLGDDRVRGHGAGFWYMANSSYDIVHKIGGAGGMSVDLHEFLITDEGTALMTIYEIVPGDVSHFRTFDPESPDDRDPNYVWGCSFQETSIETGELIFEWHAAEHVDIADTYRPIYRMGTKNDPFDWYHINSVQKDELGNYIVSARYTHSILYIDGKTKETIWQLGGKKNSFMDLSGGNATNFAWQHDARFQALITFPNTYTPPPERDGYTTKLVSLFDNAAEDGHNDYSLDYARGLLLEVTYPTPGTAMAQAGPQKSSTSEVDLSRREGDQPLSPNELKMSTINGTDPHYTVRVIQSYDRPERIRSSSQGSVQILPQGRGQDPRVLVGYGLDAAFTEYDANGTVLCDVHYGAKTSFGRGDMQSYRVYKADWIGRPRWNPSVEISDDDAEVYVSWLGATEVADWVLQCSDSQSEDDKAWADVVKIPKIHFETNMTVPDNVGGRYLRVIALDKDNRRLEYGASKILDRGIMASYFPALKDNLPQEVTHTSPMYVFLIIACNVTVLFVLYEIYRRYLSWKHGRPGGGGPLFWRNGAKYRILGDV